MDYQAFLDKFSSSLRSEGFTIHPNSPEISAAGLGLFATHPQFRDMPNRGNDMSLFVGLRYGEGIGLPDFENFVQSFHLFVGSSAGSYAALLAPYGRGRPNWNVTFPILVTTTPRNECLDFAKEFKPNMKSRFGFELDHPILVDLTTGLTYHRMAPAGRFGWGHFAEFANEFVTEHLMLVPGDDDRIS